ncbi:MAG: hypothetical protein ACF8PN_07435 [Phycisphaerales bacterium]
MRTNITRGLGGCAALAIAIAALSRGGEGADAISSASASSSAHTAETAMTAAAWPIERNSIELIRCSIDDLPLWIFGMMEPESGPYPLTPFSINEFGVVAIAIAVPEQATGEDWYFVARWQDGRFDFIDTSLLGRMRVFLHMSINNLGDVLFLNYPLTEISSYLSMHTGELIELPDSYMGHSVAMSDVSDDLWMVAEGDTYNPKFGFVDVMPGGVGGIARMNADSLGLGTTSTSPDHPLLWDPINRERVLKGLLPDGAEGGVALNDHGDILLVSEDWNYFLSTVDQNGVYESPQLLFRSDEVGGGFAMANGPWITTQRRAMPPTPLLWTPETGTIELQRLLPGAAQDLELWRPLDMNNRGQMVGWANWSEPPNEVSGGYFITVRTLPHRAEAVR